eukprot:TRINITY_DN62_c0_g1_i3.p1 TRINITY_DN62_c0_g1~~TRINITY_DN62_c0_g1_i3.p1  ORF type:complete len:134 (-),score=3.44 TRINITY_DN62_c0_g1_i3:277-678(-)
MDWYGKLLAAAAKRLDVEVSEVAAVLDDPDGDLKSKLSDNSWKTWLAISTASKTDFEEHGVKAGHAGLLKSAFPGMPGAVVITHDLWSMWYPRRVRKARLMSYWMQSACAWAQQIQHVRAQPPTCIFSRPFSA